MFQIILNRKQEGQYKDLAMIPVLKKHAGLFQAMYEKCKKLAFDEDKCERAKKYQIKSKGQWILAKDVGGKKAPPLCAAIRTEKGPAGQPPGTVATEGKEVDSIVRKVYEAIYKGNLKDQQAMVEKYMK